MAKYQSALSGQEMDTALGALKDTFTVNGVLKNDGAGNYTGVPIDSTPTASSNNLVTSGGVNSAIESSKSTYTHDGSGHITITLGGA